jgi:hypothetical protein
MPQKFDSFVTEIEQSDFLKKILIKKALQTKRLQGF